MKIRVFKEDKDIVTKFENDDGMLMDFDYIELIKKLFINEKPQIIFDNIEEEDQEKINEMYEKICKQAQLDDVLKKNLLNF